MNKEVAYYSSKHIDPKLTNILNGLKTYFGFTTKASFVFLATYGMLNYKNLGISWQDYVIPKGNDNEFRESEDNGTDPAIDILIERMGKIKNLSYEQIRTDENLVNECMMDLCRMANATGMYLLDNDLYSFKGHPINESNAVIFMGVICQLIDDIAAPSLF